MRVTKLDKSTIAGQVYGVEGAALIVMTYAFLTPLPAWAQVLFSGHLSLLMLCFGLVQEASIFQRKLLIEQLWSDELENRILLEDLVRKHNADVPLVVDWQDVTERAKSAIKVADDIEMFDNIVSPANSRSAIPLVALFAAFILRPGLAFLIAFSLNALMPALVSVIAIINWH